MKITIEANFYNPIEDIKQKYREFICKRKGHDYKPYKKTLLEYDYILMNLLSGQNRKPIKQCERCYKIIYKNIIVKEEQTIKFRKYKPLTINE